ncbi:hypothetical protein Lalb_Chr05g0226971 [Lupinus albus]|uniref:Uncharacterized protein n=1 Tax=Lupinus albus TaxID=3870 RepID=A0A6A4QLE8_LUPAL|nr:hypothetical protein Lalb_Chr05g0226971 [Lupinus albus]
MELEAATLFSGTPTSALKSNLLLQSKLMVQRRLEKTNWDKNGTNWAKGAKGAHQLHCT